LDWRKVVRIEDYVLWRVKNRRDSFKTRWPVEIAKLHFLYFMEKR
jgi:hypothetical protein